ncbi:MAG: RNA methyltransferase [Lachnospiraceae bacterium]|nr:RNA methyltransferase [Lachnospiraceae bacterium]
MITSINNPSVKNIVALQSKSKARKEQGVFLVEGPKMVSEIPEGLLKELYVSEEFKADGQYKELLKNKKYELVSGKVFREISDTQTPQGILAVVCQQNYTLDMILRKKDIHLLLLEDIQDPGNLGTMLRTGEGAGVTGVIMSKGCVDLYNPKVIRSTMGAIYRVPFLYTEDFYGIITKIKEICKVYAAHLKAKQYYDKYNYKAPTAILIGNESRGLKEETAALADILIKIPMLGKVESLNAAVAAALLMYEVYRQRRN